MAEPRRSGGGTGERCDGALRDALVAFQGGDVVVPPLPVEIVDGPLRPSMSSGFIALRTSTTLACTFAGTLTKAALQQQALVMRRPRPPLPSSLAPPGLMRTSRPRGYRRNAGQN